MKMLEVIPNQLTIPVTNEESNILGKFDSKLKLKQAFSEHDQFVIENLVRKSIISKVKINGHIYFKKN